MTITKKHPEDYARVYPIISQPIRLCVGCGGNVFPDLVTDELKCLTCNGTAWEWIQESEAEDYRTARKTQLKHRANEYTAHLPDAESILAHIDSLVGSERLTTTQMIDATELFTPRSYRDKHVPKKKCPNCGGLLIVKERRRRLNNGGDEITPFVACSMWERTGCRYKECFTDETKKSIDSSVHDIVEF